MSQKPSWRDDKRKTAERGYGGRWQKARETFLSRHPLCCFCEQKGKITAATVVDHKTPHQGDQALFWDTNNWQPLCKLCHDSTKKIMENRGVKPGADESGKPTDPNHHWNKY
ncbi:HNH endonuclease [Shewanella glacialipiscicola]|uniref:HNH endonuclease n=1 Tax=Shewanella glacialipiscicola TaxID=614069 RepID=UPI003D7AAA29